jgi:murein DD-endopeptidase MepM/ murein hydrolase activator NlpD
MLIPHDNERVRSVQVTSSSVRAILSAILVAVLLGGSFSIGFFVKASQHMRAARLQQENVLLAAEVDQMRGEMRTLSASINQLSEKDASYRTIAGLPPLDERTRQVGSGNSGATARLLSNTTIFRYNRQVGEKLLATSSDLDALMRRTNLLRSSMDEAIVTLRNNTARLEATPSIAPADGPLSSLFSRNRRHPVMRISRPHKGIDIAAATGEPILAPAKGVVHFSGYRSGGYGNMVEIDHGFGYVTRFAHCSKLLVHEGQTVERGQVIAAVGSTGLTTGPHLHYEVEVNGKQVDPLNFIITDVIPD